MKERVCILLAPRTCIYTDQLTQLRHLFTIHLYNWIYCKLTQLRFKPSFLTITQHCIFVDCKPNWAKKLCSPTVPPSDKLVEIRKACIAAVDSLAVRMKCRVVLRWWQIYLYMNVCTWVSGCTGFLFRRSKQELAAKCLHSFGSRFCTHRWDFPRLHLLIIPAKAGFFFLNRHFFLCHPICFSPH